MAKAKYTPGKDGRFQTKVWDGTYNPDGRKCATIQTATLLHTTSRWLTVPYSPSIKIWRSFPSQTIFLTISLIKVRFSSIVSV